MNRLIETDYVAEGIFMLARTAICNQNDRYKISHVIIGIVYSKDFYSELSVVGIIVEIDVKIYNRLNDYSIIRGFSIKRKS